MRDVVQLGRRARSEANLKLRQPLRSLYVRGARAALEHADEIAEELRVKDVRFDEGPTVASQLPPNLRILGPRLGARLPEVRAALKRGDVALLGGGRLRAAGEVLEPDEVLRGERIHIEGWAVDDDLRREGRVLELVHKLNAMRKDAGLELTDRIVVTLPGGQADLMAERDRIASEVLAREVVVDDGLDEPTIAKV